MYVVCLLFYAIGRFLFLCLYLIVAIGKAFDFVILNK